MLVRQFMPSEQRYVADDYELRASVQRLGWMLVLQELKVVRQLALMVRPKRDVMPYPHGVLKLSRKRMMSDRRALPVGFRVWLEPYYMMLPLPYLRLGFVRRATKWVRRWVPLWWRVMLERKDVMRPWPHGVLCRQRTFTDVWR